VIFYGTQAGLIETSTSQVAKWQAKLPQTEAVEE